MNLFDNLFNYPARNHRVITRYSGKFTIRPENNSTHISDCIAIALWFSNWINNDNKNYFNLKELIYRIAIHDNDEIIIDLPRPYKYYKDRLGKHTLLDAVKLTNELILMDNYNSNQVNDIKHAKDYNVVEGALCELIDKVQASLKIYEEYYILNNKFYEEDVDKVIEWLDQTKKEFNLIFSDKEMLKIAVNELITCIVDKLSIKYNNSVI